MGRFFLSSLLACVALCAATGCRFDLPDEDGAGGSGGTRDPQPLVVVTWNVHNLLNDQFDTDLEFEEIDKGYVAHRRAVARVLDTVGADVVMLQEVEHLGVLGELNAELASPYEHLELTEGNDPRGVDVAFMSRVPIAKVVTHRDDVFTKMGTSSPTYRYARDCLEVHLDFNGRHLALLGVHYKAKDDDDPDKRLAEAQRTRLIADSITQQDPAAGVLILGDFNDLPGSAPVEATEGDDPRYDNAAELAPDADRWSFDYNGKLELVDHQFANPLLFGMLDPSSVSIPHDDDAVAASDHAPIVATYQVR